MSFQSKYYLFTTQLGIIQTVSAHVAKILTLTNYSFIYVGLKS